MIHRAVGAVMFAFAALHVAVLVGPAAVLAITADKGGLPDAHGLDLLAGSTVLGALHGFTVWRRLRNEFRHGVAFVDAWLAAANALVVLALAATTLLFVALGGLAPEHTAILNKGWHILATWLLVQLVAIGLAEAARTGVLRWLAAGRPRSKVERRGTSDDHEVHAQPAP